MALSSWEVEMTWKVAGWEGEGEGGRGRKKRQSHGSTCPDSALRSVELYDRGRNQ